MSRAAIILSGGKSSRMGTNKALLRIAEKTNIERISDTLKPFFDDIILVTNNPDQYEFLKLKTVPDIFLGSGPLAGIHSGLMASECDINLIVACDMPFVSGALAKALTDKCCGYDAVVPVIEGKQHPLFAVYQKRTREVAAKSIEEGNLRVKSFLESLDVLYITEHDLRDFSEVDLGHIFFNMNDPNEYKDALKWVKGEQERK